MAHMELVLRVPEALVDALSDALLEEAEALSVSVEDADANSLEERPLFGEPGMPAPRSAWARSMPAPAPVMPRQMFPPPTTTARAVIWP